VARQEWRCVVAPGSEGSDTGDRCGGKKKPDSNAIAHVAVPLPFLGADNLSLELNSVLFLFYCWVVPIVSVYQGVVLYGCFSSYISVFL
jgi:hypothetical protein